MEVEQELAKAGSCFFEENPCVTDISLRLCIEYGKGKEEIRKEINKMADNPIVIERMVSDP